jgi:hypothetical protein
MKLYHASLYPMCHQKGILHGVKKTCCNFDDGFVYLGTKEYLEEQYFKYCPNGTYYIFEVDIDRSDLEYIDRVDHYRHRGNIDPEYVKPNSVRIVKGK